MSGFFVFVISTLCSLLLSWIRRPIFNILREDTVHYHVLSCTCTYHFKHEVFKYTTQVVRGGIHCVLSHGKVVQDMSNKVRYNYYCWLTLRSKGEVITNAQWLTTTSVTLLTWKYIRCITNVIYIYIYIYIYKITIPLLVHNTIFILIVIIILFVTISQSNIYIKWLLNLSIFNVESGKYTLHNYNVYKANRCAEKLMKS